MGLLLIGCPIRSRPILSALGAFAVPKNNHMEATAKQIVNSAIKVHRALGPGLLESVYQKCLAYKLEKTGGKVVCEIQFPVKYEDILISTGFRIDMLVNDSVIIENKTVDNILPIHQAQLLTYLKLSNHKLGFLLNWNVPLMKDGIKRMICDKPR